MYLTWLDSPYSYLTWFYQYSSGFMSWIGQVLSIKEWWVSILAVIIVVCLVLYIFYHKED